ncbi:hypothetical protein DL98DRAFT_656171 [Cadophora sp. DSE1049]|nr:hypothetical protein DL98DRAFT_656171 [Cadophora sp. DSE1049]
MAVSLLKICFLLFYLRIFQSKRFRYLVWILVVVNAIVAIAFIIALCIDYRPLNYTWMKWDGEHQGTCDGSTTALSLANGGVNVVLDFVTLGLPISQIWGLQMETKRKIAVISMMSVGLLILRLRSLLKLTRTSNLTWDFFDAALWSVCELNIGTICLCMPSLRLLLIRLFPTLGSRTYNSNADPSGSAVKPKGPKMISSERRKESGVAATMYSLSTLSVLVRFIARFSDLDSTFWWDDGVVLALFMLNTGLFVLSLIVVDLGLGRDIWTVPFHNITLILKLFWVNELLYFISISLLKIAFLLFFFRIFPSRRFRQVVWSLVAFNAVLALVCVIVVCTMCRPLYYVWTQWDGEHQGKCVDVNALAFANAGLCIVLDLVTLGLPITQVVKLQLSIGKKIWVTAMLSVGLIVTVISILRLKSLINFASTWNQTWDFFDAGMWSMIELDIGLICVCMPSFRVLFIKMISHFKSDTTDSNTSQKRFSVNPNLMLKVQGGAARAEKRQSVKSEGIAYERNYGVEYTDRGENGSAESVMQMVEIQGGDGMRRRSVA